MDALQQFRHRLNIVETLVVLRQLGDNEGVVLVAIHQLKLSEVRGFLLAIHLAMEHRAIDPLRVVLFVDQSLIAIDDLIQLRRIVRHGGVSELIAAFQPEGVSRFLAVLDDVLHPVGIPALGANLVTKLLSRHQTTPEAIRRTLRIRSIGREQDIAIRSHHLYPRTVNAAANYRELGAARLTQVVEDALSLLLGNVVKLLLEKRNHLRVVLLLQNHPHDVGAESHQLIER